MKKIREKNSEQFIKDIKAVREVMVYATANHTYLKVLKKEVLLEAKYKKIQYYLTDTIFVVERNVMVLL